MTVDLAKQKCVPCEGGTKPFDQKEIATYKTYLKRGWEVDEGKKIKHTFSFKDFKEAIDFVNKIADVVEEEGHHPDIHIYYNKVKIVLWTHAIGGLSTNDFILARKIEELFQESSR